MLPVHPTPAPLEYRCALDAASTLLPPAVQVRVICHEPGLTHELHQRGLLPDSSELTPASSAAALWIEPLATGWEQQAARLARELADPAVLVVAASLPLARILPERRVWRSPALGLTPGGVARLQHGLARAGFQLESVYGFHSLRAFAFSFLQRMMDGVGRSALADRLNARARLAYTAQGRWAQFSTVMILKFSRGMAYA